MEDKLGGSGPRFILIGNTGTGDVGFVRPRIFIQEISFRLVSYLHRGIGNGETGLEALGRGLLRWADSEKVVYVIWSKTHAYVYDQFGGQLSTQGRRDP